MQFVHIQFSYLLCFVRLIDYNFAPSNRITTYVELHAITGSLETYTQTVSNTLGSMKNTTFLRFCYYAIKSLIFISLSVVCYFWYMKEAIEDFDRRATTVTTRSIDHPYEAPL